MIDEQLQETAALYAFDLLETQEKSLFESQMRTSAELRAMVDELRETAATISHASPARELPAGFEERVLAAIRAEEKVIPFPRPVAWIPWAIAAALAIACTFFYLELASTRQALTAAQLTPEWAVSVLGSKFENAPRANAVVMWDAKNQSGLVRFEGVPALEPGKDYQLWVIDPSYPAPVSAGIISAQAGQTAVVFHAVSPIKDAQKFAVSIENAGGVATAAGPIVLLSN